MVRVLRWQQQEGTVSRIDEGSQDDQRHGDVPGSPGKLYPPASYEVKVSNISLFRETWSQSVSVVTGNHCYQKDDASYQVTVLEGGGRRSTPG